MDSHKIKNFKNEYPNTAFPAFRTLSIAEADHIRESVRDQLGMNPASTPLEIVVKLRDTSFEIEGRDVEADDFCLKSVVLEAGIQPNKHVLIDWYRFDNIDEIALDDLSNYFHDIWYPGADYISILDDSISWVISVGYSGEVTVWRSV